MFQHLTDLILRLHNWGYVIVFLIVMLECQAFLGFFMPGESMVVVAGFMAGQEVLDLRVLIAVVAGGAVLGDSIGYEFGRRLGREWLRRHGEKFWLRPERLDRMDQFFARYGGWGVLFAHFLHFGRALMPFLAGAARLPYLRFLAFNAIGCVLWATIFSLLGYLFGQSWHLIEHWIGRAGIIAAILGAMVVLTILLWRGIASRELEIREWWRQVLARPGVVSFRRRFARPIEWLEGRFSPEGYLGIHLTVGLFLLVAAVAIFSGVLQQFGTHGWVVLMDQRVAEWFANRSGGAVSGVMRRLSLLGSLYWLGALFLVAILLWRHYRHRVRLLLIAAPGGLILDLLLKSLFARRRLGLGEVEGVRGLFSLLEGDLITATILYGALAYVLVRTLQRWSARTLVIVGSILVILLVAMSSLYLHHARLSDVLAAMIEGAAWLLFCISGVEIVRWRERVPPALAREAT